jgi:hypothetical protein
MNGKRHMAEQTMRHLRDEFLNREALDALLEARVLMVRSPRHYSVSRPHDSLGH